MMMAATLPAPISLSMMREVAIKDFWSGQSPVAEGTHRARGKTSGANGLKDCL